MLIEGQYGYCVKLKNDVAIHWLQILNSVWFEEIQVLCKAPDRLQSQWCRSPRHQVAQAVGFCPVAYDIFSIIVGVFPLHTELCIIKVAESLGF
jgi:hypothetical protein